ncbi:SWAP/Surp [Arabidopsis thaliana x Arabidopsis arenosa]|uniref:SWAP/Surp n=1 Tax=Arabidopsis thaliana x Arabidopsis arenosa TaxID=1240361 RepID=A0A8T1ZLY8_9BRAS|nr:SWAP/Surp [Arabidopsis thaliana x Arabidopsis arenosa]
MSCPLRLGKIILAKAPSSAVTSDVITEPPPECRTMLERTAHMVSKYGLEMEKKIRDCNVDEKLFNFLRSSDPYHAFYQKRLKEFQDGAQYDTRVRVDAPLPGPDAPLRLADTPKSPPALRGYPESRFPCIPPKGITLKELALVKLTAQFVKSDSRFPYFTKLVVTYMSVLKPSEKLSKKTACRKAVLDGFFEHVGLENQEEGVSDLHAFAGCVDYFSHMEEDELPAEHLQMMMNTPPQMLIPVMPVTPPLGPCGPQLPSPSMGLMQPPPEEPEEPEPKRPRVR